METKANYVAVGAATLAGVALFLIFALWISAAQFNRAYHTFDIVFEGPVRGLARGGEVRFQGIQVGEVTALDINPDDPTEVIARVRVDADTPVRGDSVGQLEPVGLTGVNLIQITAGTTEAPVLNPALGRPPPRIDGEPSEIDKLLGAGGDIAERTSRALLAIQDLLTEENLERVSRILADVESVTESLAEQRAFAANANQALAEGARAGARIAAAAAEIERLAAALNKEAPALTSEARLAIAEIGAAAAAGRGALAQAETAAAIAAEQSLPDFAAAVQDIRRLTDAVDALSVQLQRNPNQFVSGAERPTVEVPR